VSLQADYGRLCREPSDIVQHLPTMVELVKMYDAQHVIELGTRTGVSTIAWLYGLESTGGRLTSIDIDERPPIGEYPHWTFIRGDDMDSAIYADLEPAEIVFIDTSHEYEQTVKELALYQHLVMPGGIMVLHDTELPSVGDGHHYPVRKAIEEFVAREGFEWHNMTGCWGLGVIKL
jgi:predicted O-methyltransferase YrrM